MRLGSPHAILSRTAFNCLALIAKVQPQALLEALKGGISNSDARVKTQSLRVVGILAEKVNVTILQEIVKLFQDPYISNTALQTARRLVANNPRLKEECSGDLLEAIEKGETQAPKHPSTKLEVPRILDPGVAQQIAFSQNWKEKLLAMEELKDKIPDIGEDIANHLNSILEFLNSLLLEKNFRIVNGSLLLLLQILQIKGITSKANFRSIIPACIQKLGDDKISNRYNTFRVMRIMLRELLPETMFPFYIEGLSSLNWHVREGSLVLIMAAMLEKDPVYQYEYSSLVAPVFQMVQDTKAKVRLVATETLVVIAYREGSEKVLEQVQADYLTIERLKSRLRKKVIAALKEDWVDLPKVAPDSAPSYSVVYSPSTLPKADTPENFRKNLATRLSSMSIRRPSRLSMRSPSQFEIEKPNRTPSVPAKSHALPSLEKKPNSRNMQFSPPKQAPVKAVELQYLTREDLKPLENPEEQLHKYLGFEPEDWKEQFEMLNGIRRLLKHNSELFAMIPIHSLVIKLLKYADSLRSGLAKNSLIALGEMCSSLKRLLDSELEPIMNCLLKKSTDTNVFISQEAEKSLMTLCNNSNDSRLIMILFQCVNSTRSSQIKAKVAMCYNKIIEKKGHEIRRCKELERMMHLLGALAREASADVRTNAKAALNQLAKLLGADFDKYLKRSMDTTSFQQVKEALKRPEVESPLKKYSTNELIFRKKSQSQDSFDSIKRALTSEEWVKRIEAVSKLKQISTKEKGLSSKGLSCILTALNDSDTRVTMHTLTVLSKLLPSVPQKPDLSSLIPSLSSLLNSSNTLLRNSAKDVSRTLMYEGNIGQVLPAIISQLHRGKDKSWMFWHSLVMDSLPLVVAKKPELVQKSLVPFANSVLQNEEVSGLNKKFLEKLYISVGTDLSSYLGESWPAFMKHLSLN